MGQSHHHFTISRHALPPGGSLFYLAKVDVWQHAAGQLQRVLRGNSSLQSASKFTKQGIYFAMQTVFDATLQTLERFLGERFRLWLDGAVGAEYEKQLGRGSRKA